MTGYQENYYKCLNALKDIKSKLEINYSTLMVNNDILCKTHDKNVVATASLPRDYNSKWNITVCPVASGTINKTTCSCTHTGTCETPKNECPVCNGTIPKPTPDTNIVPVGKPSSKKGECLFRIMPTDIHNGIALHAIILHGMTVDLKMIFEYTNEGVIQLVNTINFLVM